jgi:hypothetical protein
MGGPHTQMVIDVIYGVSAFLVLAVTALFVWAWRLAHAMDRSRRRPHLQVIKGGSTAPVLRDPQRRRPQRRRSGT